MTNPFADPSRWSPEKHQAYQEMPKNQWGHVVSLLFVPPKDRKRMEEEWREWAVKWKLRPVWFKRWKELKERYGDRVYTEKL